MNINKFMQSFAKKTSSQYSEYDEKKSVIIYPLRDGNRFQTVIGETKYSKHYNRAGVEFTSKVCGYNRGVDLERLMKENARFCYARFVLSDGFIEIEASAFLDNITDKVLEEIITEVAEVADEWEYKITGEDKH